MAVDGATNVYVADTWNHTIRKMTPARVVTTIAGQAGIVNHLEIGDGATIGPQSGIPKSVPAGVFLSGAIAAAPHHEWLKVMTLLPQLPKLWASVRAMERQIADLLKK
jgi:UDP-3-O-[3-hydroxymyristoyl] glucosamine N-acyltransferase